MHPLSALKRGADFRALSETVGLTYPDIARLTGLHVETIKQFGKGRAAKPEVIQLLLDIYAYQSGLEEYLPDALIEVDDLADKVETRKSFLDLLYRRMAGDRLAAKRLPGTR